MIDKAIHLDGHLSYLRHGSGNGSRIRILTWPSTADPDHRSPQAGIVMVRNLEPNHGQGDSARRRADGKPSRPQHIKGIETRRRATSSGFRHHQGVFLRLYQIVNCLHLADSPSQPGSAFRATSPASGNQEEPSRRIGCFPLTSDLFGR